MGSTITRFDYNEASQLLAESTGTVIRDDVWFADLPLGIVDRTGTTVSLAFIHADGLGAPLVVTNAAGTALWQWAYASTPSANQHLHPRLGMSSTFEPQANISTLSHAWNTTLTAITRPRQGVIFPAIQ